MLNKDIQQSRIHVLEALLESCRENPSTAYKQVQDSLKVLQESLQQNKEFYEEEYKG